MNDLELTVPAFGKDGLIPEIHTGFGEDVSPEIHISGIRSGAASLALVMDDLDIPVIGEYNHWIAWNIPPSAVIPGHIPKGEIVSAPIKAVQGIGFGRHVYRGPKQPPFIRRAHRYRFTVYALDCELTVPATSRKAKLLSAMSGHILQQSSLIAQYQPHTKAP